MQQPEPRAGGALYQAVQGSTARRYMHGTPGKPAAYRGGGLVIRAWLGSWLGGRELQLERSLARQEGVGLRGAAARHGCRHRVNAAAQQRDQAEFYPWLNHQGMKKNKTFF